MDNIYELLFDALMEKSADEKMVKVSHIYNLCIQNPNNLCFDKTPIEQVEIPGRPIKPSLVRFEDIPKRDKSENGIIATIHAICHIEFNAINLALDAGYRFQDMPKQFIFDWVKVAFEEAKHFKLLRDYLQELGFNYGDFKAHNGLWKMTKDTDYSTLSRMALVPRVLEAKGLDATPGMIKRFKNSKFSKMADILQIIYIDEIGHVKIGNYWYKYLCNLDNLDYIQTFDDLIKKHLGQKLRGPFNIDGRLKAGFTQEEIYFLEIKTVNVNN